MNPTSKISIPPTLRKPILGLHERFLCGGGWGLERTWNKWVCQQPWRQPLPTTFFEHLDDEIIHGNRFQK